MSKKGVPSIIERAFLKKQRLTLPERGRYFCIYCNYRSILSVKMICYEIGNKTRQQISNERDYITTHMYPPFLQKMIVIILFSAAGSKSNHFFASFFKYVNMILKTWDMQIQKIIPVIGDVEENVKTGFSLLLIENVMEWSKWYNKFVLLVFVIKYAYFRNCGTIKYKH